jgi:hypothetical protein
MRFLEGGGAVRRAPILNGTTGPGESYACELVPTPAEFVAQANSTDQVVHTFARGCGRGACGILRVVEQLQIKKLEAKDHVRRDRGFTPAPATHAVRREVPVVVTGAPVESVVVPELENWT